MLGTRVVIKRGSRDEAEKPFWISFSDMMSALMVLFLVVMSVALLAVTKKVSEEEQRKADREKDISELLARVSEAAKSFGLTVSGNSINFGSRAEFDFKRYDLPEEKAAVLRAFVPEVLKIADDPRGREWLKRVVVEGFTDQTGSYLTNLHLSLLRSERVLCILLTPPPSGQHVMSEDQRDQVKKLFLVGGYSSNSAKATPEESRRIELRLEFLALDEPKRPQAVPRAADSTPSADRCPI